jgi:type VI secretion system secreted protein VgrG
VVGRQGEEIHTDEFGRVRVQFHWDRRGRRDDESSCWIPVSQPLAGGGFGGINLPRVGQEVLVDFLGGDPDRPIVVGRVYTNTQKVPYSLPDQKNKSGWKSWSTPGGGGFNEIAFEDTQGAEQFLIQAEKDLHKLVKNDESETIMGSRRVSVGGSRNTSVGSVDASVVGAKHSVTMTQPMRDAAGAYVSLPPTGTEMRDQFIKLTTGQASITMNGSNITIEAASISLMATTLNLAGSGETRLAGGDYLNMGSGRGDVQMQAPSGEIRINGGPMVKING